MIFYARRVFIRDRRETEHHPVKPFGLNPTGWMLAMKADSLSYEVE
jgi:hypothetical protein